jgi:lysophospholipase L1-like esterase
MASRLIKYIRLIFIIVSILLLFFNAYYFFVKRGVGPSFYVPKLFNAHHDNILETRDYLELREEYKVVNKGYSGREVIVFLGDSITKRFSLNEYFPGITILNRGIFSDTTRGVLERIDDNVNSLQIDKLFLMLGYNDLQYRDNPEILRNMDEIVSRVRARKIFIQSVLPVSSYRKQDNARIVELNQGLQELAARKNCHYVDLHSSFVDENGGIKVEYSRDGVHPNVYGMQLWRKIIDQLVFS